MDNTKWYDFELQWEKARDNPWCPKDETWSAIVNDDFRLVVGHRGDQSKTFLMAVWNVADGGSIVIADNGEVGSIKEAKELAQTFQRGVYAVSCMRPKKISL